MKEEDLRLYQCARCRCLVTICRYCDRGHRYCPDCSPIARQVAQRQANQRYQASLKGKYHHAKRQRRYRQRLREAQKKVTYQGSIAVETVSSSDTDAVEAKPCLARELTYCHFCARSGVKKRHTLLRSSHLTTPCRAVSRRVTQANSLGSQAKKRAYFLRI